MRSTHRCKSLPKFAGSEGVALITTMLLTAIVAIVASEITDDRFRITDRTIKLIASDQGIVSIWSIENYVKILLAKDAENSQADFPGEDWNINATIPVDNGVISGRMTDESAKFNINNILQADENGRFVDGYSLNPVGANRLLNLFRNLDVDQPEELTLAVIDFIDGDGDISRNLKPYRGAEDSYYLQQDPAYRTANRPLFDLSELKLVRGVDTKTYQKIEPHLTALPIRTAVNVNFASAQTIRMLSSSLTVDIADEILRKQNKEDAFQNYSQAIGFITAYTGDNALANELSANVISVKSQFIKLSMTANLSGSVTNAVSIIHRKNQQSSVVRRTFGS